MILLLPASAQARAQATGKTGAGVAASAAEGSGAKAPSSVTRRFEKQGLVVDFSIKSTPGSDGKDAGLVSGADATVTFKVSDARTGEPVRGLYPKAWISAVEAGRSPGDAECKDKVRSFMGGLLSVPADIDLNNYLLLTLNHDKTITFINPQVSFNITKLESIIVLPGAGADWVPSKNKDFLYVTMPDQSSVAVINTITRKLVGTIPTGDKTRPMRIAVQPDGRYVWVGLDGSPAVAVIETEGNRLASTIQVGSGLHNIAFTSDSRFAYVTNSRDDTVSAIDIRLLRRVADIGVGKTPVPVAYSTKSELIYVAAINGEAISVIDPARQQVARTIPVRRGVVALRFEPEGRYGFIVNQVDNSVSVFDAATSAPVATAEVVKGPDQVTFTGRFAYVRGTGSEHFSLLDLGGIKTGKLAPINIQGGRAPASQMPEEIGVADMIVPTPEGNSVMVANTPDQMIYYYVEGMMATMGTLQNYKRRPHALMIIDRSLSETGPGLYSTPVKLKEAGHFEVPMLIDQPRLINCFQLEIAEAPGGKSGRTGVTLAVEPLFKGEKFRPDNPALLRFKITDSITGKPVLGLRDVQVLSFEPPGIWQQRQWAKEAGEGLYEATQAFPRDGLYRVMIRVSSRGIEYADLPFTLVPVVR
jgi:YVTN family beta-propeller protein